MTPLEYQHQLLQQIDLVQCFDDSAGPLAAPLRQAFLDVPRHLFVHRYRPGGPDGRLFELGLLTELTPDKLAEHLPVIYRNAVLMHVDASGNTLRSSNSEPAFILRVVEQLDLQPGQRVLEIGSGSGWLAAIMGRMVGPNGRVTGVEIIPELAAQSREDLAAAGIANVEIVSGDGGDGWAAGAPYDRVIFTAGAYGLPAGLYDQVREGGLLVAPFQIPYSGEDVVVLRKTGDRFRSLRATAAFFVPLTGARAAPVGGGILRLDALPLWSRLQGHIVRRRKLWFGGPSPLPFIQLTTPFRRFLGKFELGVTLFETATEGQPASPYTQAFGVVDEEAGSLALFRPHTLTGYGTPDAYERCLAAYRNWTELGMPGGGGLQLEVRRADPGVPTEPGGFAARRGDSVFVWSVPTDPPQPH